MIFTPDTNQTVIDVPYFEDATTDYAPGYSTGKSIKTLEGEVLSELHKLEAGGYLVAGVFQIGKHKRYGFELRFNYKGGSGVIRIAGLPIRKETDKRVEAVKKQALFNLRDWLKASVTMQTFGDRGAVLIPYMLGDGGETIADYVIRAGMLPQLSTGEVVDADFE